MREFMSLSEIAVALGCKNRPLSDQDLQKALGLEWRSPITAPDDLEERFRKFKEQRKVEKQERALALIKIREQGRRTCKCAYSRLSGQKIISLGIVQAVEVLRCEKCGVVWKVKVEK